MCVSNKDSSLEREIERDEDRKRIEQKLHNCNGNSKREKQHFLVKRNLQEIKQKLKVKFRRKTKPGRNKNIAK